MLEVRGAISTNVSAVMDRAGVPIIAVLAGLLFASHCQFLPYFLACEVLFVQGAIVTYPDRIIHSLYVSES